ncbi:MAG: ferrochelatase [Gammaproteobacteria bacterium]
MSSYQGQRDYAHGTTACTGVLLSNLGTPDAPTPPALRRYLAEFLSDPRVIETPRWLWWPILHGVILRIRPRRAAHAYGTVWTEQGSPLLAISQRQTRALQAALAQRFKGPVQVALGMRYGNPSLRAGLEALRAAGARRLLVLPLYPQYSATTTASTFDAVAGILKTWRWQPELRFVNNYHADAGYIAAIADSVRAHWLQHGEPERLMFSFHGLPKRYLLAGDPYHCECYATARQVAAQLGLPAERWQLTFQSRFGREEWLKPYCDQTLRAWGKAGVKRVDVVCPGFSADCLETLEEINQQNRAIFLAAGGGAYHYIPALNDSPAHITMLGDLIALHTQGWPETAADWDESRNITARALSQQQALTLGAPR